MGLLFFLATYLFGGLTFIPLVLWVGIAVGTSKFEGHDEAGNRTDGDEVKKTARNTTKDGSKSDSDTDWGVDGLDHVRMAGLEGFKRRTHVPDVAAGYFAVCREYVPGGINGKPPERTTPAGSVIANESPSVYQSMYRSIFDRNKSFTPTMEGANGKSKKARNVFYVILRLGHLMLYDDSEQLEVRHVISLTHYDVSVYSGGELVPEGELWIKRNCIRLTQRPQTNVASDSKPFYLFSENCSEKEDFYHAMLQSLERREDEQQSPPLPLTFETSDLVRLVQQLHASEENLHTRWINALIGRIFLALYKTSHVERILWTKITKKIARVPKPALISSIKLQKIDMGNLPPFITNPRLKELTVDGDLTVEADVSYKGNFCLEISAIARIELGSRFKAREVTLVLASILKSLEGHILVRIKPPPSNRIWITFETAPKIEMSLEPIVSSRQITYGVILRAIESRIREVVNETLVLPNWDDMPFSDTLLNQFRGGIWANDTKHSTNELPQPEDSEQSTPEKTSESEESELPVSSVASSEATKGISGLKETAASQSRRPASSNSNADIESTGISSATDIRSTAKPKAMRSGSFASVASPIVNLKSANASISSSEERKGQKDASSAMKTTIARSQPTSPVESPVGSPTEGTATIHHDARRSTSPASFADRNQGNGVEPPPVAESTTFSSPSSNDLESESGTPYAKSRHGSSMSLPRNAFGPSADKRQSFNQSLNSATAVAKKWLTSRQNSDNPSRPQTSNSTWKTSDEEIQDFLNGYSSQTAVQANIETTPPLGSPAHPIGRGQPLPPPGTPLPHPPKPDKKTTWSVPAAATFANLTRRKTSAKPPQTQAQPRSVSQGLTDSDSLFEPSSSSSSSIQAPAPVKQQHAAREKTGSADNHNRERHVRRKASTSSTQSSSLPPPLPKRRQQRMASVTDAAIKKTPQGQQPESLFIVEAPPQDSSVPTSPTDARGEDRAGDERQAEVGGRLKSRKSVSSRKSVHSLKGMNAGEEEVFPAMEIDNGV